MTETRKISDDELAEVSGGRGKCDPDEICPDMPADPGPRPEPDTPDLGDADVVGRS